MDHMNSDDMVLPYNTICIYDIYMINNVKIYSLNLYK